MNRKSIIIAYSVIIIAAALHAHSVRAETPAHQGAVAANWCNYLGPDCRPYGLSPKAYAVFKYLIDPENMTSVGRRAAAREIYLAITTVGAKDKEACTEARDIAKAMRGSRSPDMKRRGRELFDLIGKECE